MSSTTREDRAQERAIDKSIDETKDTARRVLREVKRELPEITATFHDYQEKNISNIREMTNTFLESQKEVAKSIQYMMRPYTSNPMLFIWPWMHPQVIVDNYIRAVNNFADVAVSGARMSNDLVQAAMESTRSSIATTKENTTALSAYFVDSVSAMEEPSGESPRRR